MFCDIGIVRKFMLERGKSIAHLNDDNVRLEMQKILQLENEYAYMTLASHSR
jgi:hypothetical protein